MKPSPNLAGKRPTCCAFALAVIDWLTSSMMELNKRGPEDCSPEPRSWLLVTDRLAHL